MSQFSFRLFVAIAAIGFADAAGGAGEKKSRPNIILCMADGMAGSDEWFAIPASVSTYDPYIDPGSIGRAMGDKRSKPKAVELRAGFIRNDNGPGPPISKAKKEDGRLQGSAGPFRERKASIYIDRETRRRRSGL